MGAIVAERTVGQRNRAMAHDPAAAPGSGIVAEGTIGDGRSVAIHDPATGASAIAGQRTAADGQRPFVVDASTKIRVIAGQRAARDGQYALVEDASPKSILVGIRSRVIRNGAAADCQGRRVENTSTGSRIVLGVPARPPDG